MPIARSQSMWAVAPSHNIVSERTRPNRTGSSLSLSPEGSNKGGRKFLKRNRHSLHCTLYTPQPCLSGDVDAVDSEGKSLIFYAARYGQTDTAEQLIEAGCDLNQKDHDGNTPLHEAIATGNLDVAEIMLDKGQPNVDIEGKHGESLLLIAVSRGQLDVVKMLHRHGADLDKADACGNTPLYKALHRGWIDVANFLLDHHCDVNKITTNGKSCLYAAAHCNKIKCQNVVKHLLKTGYDFKKDADWITEEGCPVSPEVDASLHRKILERAGLKPSKHKTSFRRKFVKTLRRFSKSPDHT